ncbi:MAG: hypothetical protein ACKPKO_20400 [Candidatus Fonsibacter sp.]
MLLRYPHEIIGIYETSFISCYNYIMLITYFVWYSFIVDTASSYVISFSLYSLMIAFLVLTFYLFFTGIVRRVGHLDFLVA